MIQSLLALCFLCASMAAYGQSEASPEELTRRLYLDLYNRLPKEAEYLKSKEIISSGKYNSMVNEMLLNDEFRRNLANRLINYYAPDMQQGFDLLQVPLRDFIIENHTGPKKDFRKFLYDYITAEGIQYSNPMTTFYASTEQTPDIAGRIAQRVVGLPYNCARCHDHKDYEKISHSDFWEFASFFNTTTKQIVFQSRQVEVVGNKLSSNKESMEESLGKNNYAKIMKWVDAEKRGKNVFLEDYGAGGMMMQNNPMVAKVPQIVIYEKEIDLSRLRIKFKAETQVKTAYAVLPDQSQPVKGRGKPRTALAEWVISRNNPYTAKVVSSWMAHWLLGHSFINPVTDVYGGGGPRARVLDQCAAILKKKNWSLASLAALLLTSKFYKMKTSPKNDPGKFAEFTLRRYRHLSGEQLINSVSQYSDRKIHNKKLRKLIEFKKQKEKNEITSKFFPSSLEDEDSHYSGTLGQSLYMANNDNALIFINRVAKDAHASKDSRQKWVRSIIRSFYTREPTEKEMKFFADYLDKESPYETSGYFEVAWTLFNSPEMRLY